MNGNPPIKTSQFLFANAVISPAIKPIGMLYPPAFKALNVKRKNRQLCRKIDLIGDVWGKLIGEAFQESCR